MQNNFYKIYILQKILAFEDQKNLENQRVISLTYKTPYENFDKILWLTKRELCLEKSENHSYLILNPSGNGYYRSNYNDDLWHTILNELRSNYTNFSSFTRANLIDDAYNLARYGIIKYDIVFKLTSIVMDLEQSYLPWNMLLNNFDYLYRNMQDFPSFYYLLVMYIRLFFIIFTFRDKIHDLYSILNYINFQEYFISGIQNANINDAALLSENPNEVKDTDDLILLLEKWSCKLGLANCTSKKRDEFEIILNGNLFPEIQNTEEDLYTIMCTVIKYGGVDEWNRVYRKFLEASNHFSSALIRSLGCTREPALISTYVNFLSIEDQIWGAHHFDIITEISENQIMLKYAMEYFYRNWLKVRELYDLQDFSIIFKRISTEKDYKIVRQLTYFTT